MPDYIYLEESKAVQDARREFVNTLPKIFTQENYPVYLHVLSTFHNYTPENAILIHNARENASAVAGFNAWRNIGRTVMRGEHGVPLLVPTTVKSFERPKIGPDGKYVLNPDGTRQMETVGESGVGYRKVYVFDVSQTTELNLSPEQKAKLSPVPEKPDWNKHSDAVLRTIEEACPYAVEYDSPEENGVLTRSDGYFDRGSQIIHVNKELDGETKVKAILGNWAFQEYDAAKEKERDPKVLFQTMVPFDPVEESLTVNSIAFMTADALGLDAENMFTPRLTEKWVEKQGTSGRLDFLNKIRDISHKMISDMDEKYPEILKEVELEKEQAEQKPVEEPVSKTVPEPEAEPAPQPEEAPSEPELPETENSNDETKAPDDEKKRKIDDFGEKIGGARKDLWKKRGLTLEDLEGWNAEERENLIKKASIWPTPNYKELCEKGGNRVGAYAVKMLRDCLPSKPAYLVGYTKEQCQEFYINFISDVKNMAMNELYKARSDIGMLTQYFLEDHGYIKKIGNHHYEGLPKSDNCVTNKVLNTFMNMSYGKAEREADKKEFLFTEEEKLMAGKQIMKVENTGLLRLRPESNCVIYNDLTNMVYCYGTKDLQVSDIESGKYIVFDTKNHRINGINYDSKQEAYDDTLNKQRTKAEAEKAKKDEERKQRRKGKLKPPMLKDVERIGGEDYRNGRDVTGEDYLKTFGFRGGEFGNWLNDNERQHSLNFGYDSFKDLAKALDISDKDAALDGHLAIAFGARGHGGALAHYEPARQVINLTKMKGAGSLGHEWIHAMDDYVGKSLGYNGMLSETGKRQKGYPESFKKLMDTIKYHPNTPESWRRHLEEGKESNYNTLSRRIDAVSKAWDDPKDEQKRKELKQAVIDETRTYDNPTGNPDIVGENTSPAFQAYIDFQKDHGDVRPEYNISYINKVRESIAYQQDALLNHPENIPKVPGNTKFFNDAEAIDGEYAKSGHGYWSSNCELLARAGAAYIKDKLTDLGIRDDYLSGHAEQPPVPAAGGLKYIYPIGEDRKSINKAFDEFFADMRERGLFHSNEKTLDQVLENKEKTAEERNSGMIAAEKKLEKEER